MPTCCANNTDVGLHGDLTPNNHRSTPVMSCAMHGAIEWKDRQKETKRKYEVSHALFLRAHIYFNYVLSF